MNLYYIYLIKYLLNVFMIKNRLEDLLILGYFWNNVAKKKLEEITLEIIVRRSHRTCN
jgi:hypothetical protein